ncbi:MAG TPA: class I SAM-dependent methyltransferase [Balneolales bacterium]|nr:class I SAM-dependent methyltransferase [Balneolales bacterium]
MSDSTSISYTAAFILIKLYGMSLDPQLHLLIDKKAQEYYLRTIPHLPFPLNLFHKILKYPAVRKSLITLEDNILPGDLMHLLMRKKYIYEELVRARTDGFEQLVVIGSGFDFAGIRWAMWGGSSFELDRPRTHALKKKLNRVSQFNPPTLWYLPVGENENDFDRMLRVHPFFDPDKPTVFIAEGFLDYLSKEEVYQAFESIKNTSDQSQRFVFTLFDFEAMNPLHARIIRDSVAVVGEKLGYNIGRKHIEKLLAEYGFWARSIVDPHMMRNEKLAPLGIANPLFTDFYIIRADSVEIPETSKPAPVIETNNGNEILEEDLGSILKSS